MLHDTNSLLTILAIMSILSFTRTLVYLLYQKNILNVAGRTEMDVDPYLNKVFLIFSSLRIILSSIVLYKRQFQNDILSYVLIFLIFSSLQRFYYDYLIRNHSDSKIKLYLDKIQDLNSILVFLSSLYIMKYILF